MFDFTRRRVLGAALLCTGAVLSACGHHQSGNRAKQKGRTLLDRMPDVPRGLINAASFPLIDAIHGRRSRRFARGSSIPAGPLAHTSQHAPQPLSELEELVLLTSVSGNTGWSNLIPYNRFYLPNMPNYAGDAGGRTFPSAAGFHTTELFFTNDNGSYFFPTRDMPSRATTGADDQTDMAAFLDIHKSRLIKLSGGRMNIPASPEHMEMHNEWCANVPGSTLIFPVSDLAEHSLLTLCYLVQNGACIFDDLKNQPIPGLERFKDIIDLDHPYPLSVVEQMSLTDVTVENATACYSGALMLQAMGLGGWMYSGINTISVLGASGDPDVPGLGFRFDTDTRWPLPNVTGLDGIFEGHCPPHFTDMRSAVESVVTRKFGTNGPFNTKTPGPYKNNAGVRGGGIVHNEAFVDCVTTMAQYMFDKYGRFPVTVPSIFAKMFLQAHQLDTEFYDKHFEEGAYLNTHARYQQDWA